MWKKISHLGLMLLTKCQNQGGDTFKSFMSPCQKTSTWLERNKIIHRYCNQKYKRFLKFNSTKSTFQENSLLTCKYMSIFSPTWWRKLAKKECDPRPWWASWTRGTTSATRGPWTTLGRGLRRIIFWCFAKGSFMKDSLMQRWKLHFICGITKIFLTKKTSTHFWLFHLVPTGKVNWQVGCI